MEEGWNVRLALNFLSKRWRRIKVPNNQIAASNSKVPKNLAS